MALSQLKNYIEDDWDDNALINRSSSESGYFLHPSDNITSSGDYEAGDALKGVYRPEWVVTDGDPSASNGVLVLPPNDSGDNFEQLRTANIFLYGSVSFDFQQQSSSSNGGVGRVFYSDARTSNVDGDCCLISIGSDDDPEYNFSRRDDGSSVIYLISAWWDADTQNHSSKATRDSYSNFEFFYDGTSQGTTTDTTHTDRPLYLWFYSGFGYNSTMHIDNFVVR